MIILAMWLVHLTGPEGQLVELNPEAVVTLRDVRESDAAHFAKGVKCLIHTTDGKFVAVIETCAKVRQLLLEDDQ